MARPPTVPRRDTADSGAASSSVLTLIQTPSCACSTSAVICSEAPYGDLIEDTDP